MSNSDSFIDEVSEEVRKDKLYASFKKWAWLPVLVVVAAVGGASYNEWVKSSYRNAAEALGDALRQVSELEAAESQSAALGEIVSDNSVVVRFSSAQALADEGNKGEAIAVLEQIAADGSLSSIYRDLATLKLVLLQGSDQPADDRLAALASLAQPGAPYQLIAQEQAALIEIETGKTDAALERLMAMLEQNGLTRSQGDRVRQLIIALGGELPSSTI